MGIRFVCHQCGFALHVKDFQAGKRGKCPDCKCSFRIPATDSSYSSALEASEEDSGVASSELVPELFQSNMDTKVPAIAPPLPTPSIAGFDDTDVKNFDISPKGIHTSATGAMLRKRMQKRRRQLTMVIILATLSLILLCILIFVLVFRVTTTAPTPTAPSPTASLQRQAKDRSIN